MDRKYTELLYVFDRKLSERVKKIKERILPEKKVFGRILKEIRKKAGIERGVIISFLGKKSPHLVAYYENGKAIPSNEYIECLGNLAGINQEEVENLKKYAEYLRQIHKTKKNNGRKLYRYTQI